MMTIAATGHRPSQKTRGVWISKLVGSSVNPFSREVFDLLTECAQGALAREIKGRPSLRVIVGMAQGWDLAVAVAALRLEQIDLALEACLPFEGHGTAWKSFYHEVHREVCADPRTAVTTLDEAPSDKGDAVEKLHARNRHMVDAAGPSGLLLALSNGDPIGGTANCLAYAEKAGVRVVNAWPEWLELRARLERSPRSLPHP